MRVHLFPSRTQKISSCTPTILGGRLPGKIGNANTKASYESRRFFYLWEQVEGPPCRLWYPAKTSPVETGLFSADHGAHCACPWPRHWRRASSWPSRTQKLSSSAPTIRQSTRYNASFTASDKLRLYLGFSSPHKGLRLCGVPIILATGPVCGIRHPLRLTKQACVLPTAAQPARSAPPATGSAERLGREDR